MRNEMTRRPSTLFENLLGDEFLNNVSYGTGIDIYKEDDKYLVDVEMPGFTKEDIDVQFNGDILTIKADHKDTEEKNEKDYYYRSRKHSSVNRQIRFADVDESKVDAVYENGILQVILPKKNQEEVVNRISIK
ncbi:Hsp20/alpha crystallin family protein [Erysipelothrix sp. HDW6C]|uniref:Hsp20/alpha crystallin family protein n=1 Tax=Erysipelothrix sp. HDW6C TaxID=2714930 RepID=UPI00140C94A9|nr:Hsp20/alpha crystallin family protein [Erysipelothrix sp. HDW6C]QIK70468.1 Hsp20/alpha crystallin family protein [Erysipelothrix sp. HDW6C]